MELGSNSDEVIFIILNSGFNMKLVHMLNAVDNPYISTASPRCAHFDLENNILVDHLQYFTTVLIGFS